MSTFKVGHVSTKGFLYALVKAFNLALISSARTIQRETVDYSDFRADRYLYEVHTSQYFEEVLLNLRINPHNRQVEPRNEKVAFLLLTVVCRRM